MAAFKRPAMKVPGSRDHPSAGRGVKVHEREGSPIQCLVPHSFLSLPGPHTAPLQWKEASRTEDIHPFL